MSRVVEVMTYTEVAIDNAISPIWKMKEEIVGCILKKVADFKPGDKQAEGLILTSSEFRELMNDVALFFDELETEALAACNEDIKEAQILDERIFAFLESKKRGD